MFFLSLGVFVQVRQLQVKYSGNFYLVLLCKSGGWEEVSGPLDLKLRMIASCHMVLGTDH